MTELSSPHADKARTAPTAHPVLVATDRGAWVVDPERGTITRGGTGEAGPTCLAVAPGPDGLALCGLRRGLLRSADGGATWSPSGLEERRVSSIAFSPVHAGLVWAGTEPSAVWRSDDGGRSWEPTRPLDDLPSAGEWSFPPRPETHHARWIACHPRDPDRLWVAIEAGALIHTRDGGRTWHDRVPGGPYDTHELAVHRDAPEHLRVAAGDGYYESRDGGERWSSPEDGLEVGYLRSVAIDPGNPEVVVVSAASHPHAAYGAGRSDGRVFRRSGSGAWERVREGWPERPSTIAPLLRAGTRAGELWSADERGVHRSEDGGRAWELVAAYREPPRFVMGLEIGTAP